jgi:hypothetical protein
MIGGVKSDGSYANIYDENGSQKGSVYIGGKDCRGFSPEFLAVEDPGNCIYLFDEHGKQKTSVYLSGRKFGGVAGRKFGGVVGNELHVTDGCTTCVYDSGGNQTRSF